MGTDCEMITHSPHKRFLRALGLLEPAASATKPHHHPIWGVAAYIPKRKQRPPTELRKAYLNVFLPNSRAEQILCLPVGLPISGQEYLVVAVREGHSE